MRSSSVGSWPFRLRHVALLVASALGGLAGCGGDCPTPDYQHTKTPGAEGPAVALVTNGMNKRNPASTRAIAHMAFNITQLFNRHHMWVVLSHLERDVFKGPYSISADAYHSGTVGTMYMSPTHPSYACVLIAPHPQLSTMLATMVHEALHVMLLYHFVLRRSPRIEGHGVMAAQPSLLSQQCLNGIHHILFSAFYPDMPDLLPEPSPLDGLFIQLGSLALTNPTEHGVLAQKIYAVFPVYASFQSAFDAHMLLIQYWGDRHLSPHRSDERHSTQLQRFLELALTREYDVPDTPAVLSKRFAHYQKKTNSFLNTIMGRFQKKGIHRHHYFSGFSRRDAIFMAKHGIALAYTMTREFMSLVNQSATPPAGRFLFEPDPTLPQVVTIDFESDHRPSPSAIRRRTLDGHK